MRNNNKVANILKILLIGVIGVQTFTACEEKESSKTATADTTKPAEAVAPKEEAGTFKDDRDGKSYKWVKIGKQVWMAENLNYAAKNSKCYDNSENNCQKYGRLYDWKTAAAACPKGWHLASWAEWDTLVAAIAVEQLIEGKHLKAKSGWTNNGNGLDSYGFAALPGGYGYPDGSFETIGSRGHWWSIARENDFCEVRYRDARDDADYLGSDFYIGGRLFSARCIQGEPADVKEFNCSDEYDGGS